MTAAVLGLQTARGNLLFCNSTPPFACESRKRLNSAACPCGQAGGEAQRAPCWRAPFTLVDNSQGARNQVGWSPALVPGVKVLVWCSIHADQDRMTPLQRRQYRRYIPTYDHVVTVLM